MTGYVMFRKDRLGRRGGGVILYIKESIQAYEIKLEKEAECEEAVWCNIVTGKSTLTVGLVYRGILTMGIYIGHLYRVPGERIKSF
ncbi:hypothetical protein NP493_1748g00000 [Ridgeia piscesae]|uniref:Uncharacterized protein n=1 Tax=Ridgeia piscesae TaxID=27915 RepID=A0AAD9N9F7_RIDPI|nr:hypothetical protein NP493_1748g00000 [Ridgeia piscesae]